MFQDDRMIPVLSAFVLMITLGTFLQRLDVVDRWLGGGDARPALVLLDDQAVTTAGTLLRMDVLANDEGVSNEMRQGLTIVSGPGCGRIYVRDGALEYLPGSDCVGQHIIRYGLEGAGDDKVAAVIARVHPGGNSVARATRVRAGEEPRMVARHDEAAALPDLGPPNGARGDGVLAQRTGGTAGATVGWQGDGSAGAAGAGPQVDAAPPSMASAGNAAPYLAPTGLAMNAPHPETAARGTSAVGTGAADGLDGAQTDRPLADAAAAHARPAAALDSDLAKLRGHPAQTDRAAAAGERCPAADFGGSPDVAATADALHVAAVGAPPAAPALVHAGGTAAAGSAAPVAGVATVRP